MIYYFEGFFITKEIISYIISILSIFSLLYILIKTCLLLLIICVIFFIFLYCDFFLRTFLLLSKINNNIIIALCEILSCNQKKNYLLFLPSSLKTMRIKIEVVPMFDT